MLKDELGHETIEIVIETNPLITIPEFPVLSTVADVTDFVVATFVPDVFLRQRSLDITEVKEMIGLILKVDDWEQQRDASLRRTELFGRTSLKQDDINA